MILILVGIVFLLIFADTLSGAVDEFMLACETKALERDAEAYEQADVNESKALKEYELEVDVDTETGQRTSTIVHLKKEDDEG